MATKKNIVSDERSLKEEKRSYFSSVEFNSDTGENKTGVVDLIKATFDEGEAYLSVHSKRSGYSMAGISVTSEIAILPLDNKAISELKSFLDKVSEEKKHFDWLEKFNK